MVRFLWCLGDPGPNRIACARNILHDLKSGRETLHVREGFLDFFGMARFFVFGAPSPASSRFHGHQGTGLCHDLRRRGPGKNRPDAIPLQASRRRNAARQVGPLRARAVRSFGELAYRRSLGRVRLARPRCGPHVFIHCRSRRVSGTCVRKGGYACGFRNAT